MRIIFASLLFLSFSSFGQPHASKAIDYEGINLHPPMEIDLILAGNFGEMRANHFHTGLDIKTKGVEGQKLFSVEEGYISRIRVSPWGYGFALYIDHPNGLTSLYGHMQKFTPEIDSLVHKYQVKRESWIVDEVVLQDSFYVSRGQLIGLSGNSGSSSAAHLHFELRETESEHALNPLLFKCYRDKIQDKTKPRISGVKLYAVTEKGYMIPGKSKYYPVSLSGGSWVLNYNRDVDISSLVCENSYLAIGVHVTDKLDGAGNICGVYNTHLAVNGEEIHQQKMEYINFDNNRFLNSHQDYYEYDQNNKNVHKQFATIVNPLGIYPQNDGKIEWKDALMPISFTAIDVHGNSQKINFKLKRSSEEVGKNSLDETNKYLWPDSVNTILRDNFQLLMESGTFYEPLERILRIDSSAPYLSPKFQFSEYPIPVQKYFDVRLKVPEDKSTLPLDKLGIGRISDRGWLSFLGGDYIEGWVESTSRNFGAFVLTIDTVPPKITPLDFRDKKVISRFKNVQFELADNLAGIASYKAYLNGKWVATVYDRKKKRYIIPFDKWAKPILREGDNRLRIIVTDRKRNQTEAVYTLVR